MLKDYQASLLTRMARQRTRFTTIGLRVGFFSFGNCWSTAHVIAKINSVFQAWQVLAILVVNFMITIALGASVYIITFHNYLFFNQK